MGVLKRKPEQMKSIGVRVPLSIHKEIATLRKLADENGFDLGGSLTDAVVRWTKQVRDELESGNGSASRNNLSAGKARGAVLDGGGVHRGSGEGQD
jgi:hypothetical protein